MPEARWREVANDGARRRRTRTRAARERQRARKAAAAAGANSSSQQPGLGYRLGRTLCISLTNESNAMTLTAARGSAFKLPAASGYAPLADDYEPSVDDILKFVDKELQSESDG